MEAGRQEGGRERLGNHPFVGEGEDEVKGGGAAKKARRRGSGITASASKAGILV